MDNNKYMKMLYCIDDYFCKDIILVIDWANGLKVKCLSETGVNEAGAEPGEEGYSGDYWSAVKLVEVLEQGRDDSILIYHNFIEIGIYSIPEKIMLEDGTVLWQK